MDTFDLIIYEAAPPPPGVEKMHCVHGIGGTRERDVLTTRLGQFRDRGEPPRECYCDPPVTCTTVTAI
jgi:hypothetical protein